MASLPLEAVSPPARTASRAPRFANTQASVLLDLLRGCAALVVLLEHWKLVFLVDLPDVKAHRFLVGALYLFVSAGHQAVIVFFVLSGYLISDSIFRMFEKGRWSWTTYGVHRLTRLWIVLLPGLVLAAIADGAGMHLHRAAAVTMYTGKMGTHMVPNVHATTSLLDWLGNLFFLQTIYVPFFGSDGALWSLANEFWYYVLFPLGFLALRPGTRISRRVLYGVLFAAVAALVHRPILMDFPVWLLGTLLAVLPARRLPSSWRWLAAPPYIILMYATAKAPFLRGIGGDWVLGAATAFLVWLLLGATSESNEAAPSTRVIRTLARFSYSLYMVHTPLLVLIAALVLSGTRWQPDAPHLAASLLAVLGVTGVSFLFASVTEFRTDKVRSAIERRIAS